MLTYVKYNKSWPYHPKSVVRTCLFFGGATHVSDRRGRFRQKVTERDFPSTLGKTIHKFIAFPLQHRLIRHIFAAEKTSNNPQNNLDYETYTISNRSGNRDDNIRKRPETYQHSG